MDKQINIASAPTRSTLVWQNRTVNWSDLVDKCSRTTRTHETVEEYSRLNKDAQSNIKDVGGFVGGYLIEGKRKKGHVKFRDVLCLDIDYGKQGVWDAFTTLYPNVEAFVYSTHKHTASIPRLRLVIPFKESITPEQYEVISLTVAAKIGKELFDPTTFEPERLMYWPSTSKDGDWFFQHQQGEALDVEEVLRTSYTDWRDASEWPIFDREVKRRSKEQEKQGDPTMKPGMVGAFCRAYDIHSAIATFLPEVYKQEKADRYTYVNGSVSSGLVVYEDGKFAYSNNATDPCSQRLVNAFDLVRLHRFGALDEGLKEDTPINRLRSYQEMEEFARKDKNVVTVVLGEKMKDAMEDFSDVPISEGSEQVDDDSWSAECEIDKKGAMKNTIKNLGIVLESSPQFKDKIWLDLFSTKICCTGAVPWDTRKTTREWSNTDDSCLRVFLEKKYGITGKDRIYDALVTVAKKRAKHPVVEYLHSLEWDQTERLDTFFVDFLGAADTPLVRAFTRKHLVAAVARVMDPGVKYDQILTLVGKEGIGKSSILRKLAGADWFNDSIRSLDGKEGMEAIQGSWLVEVAELVGIRKAENENIKNFLSSQVDKYRPAYGRRTEHKPRQCVFFATTNERGFLKGDTGNRRYWVVETGVNKPRKDVFRDLDEEYRNQVWAEAVVRYKAHEELIITNGLLEDAKNLQNSYNENAEDDRIGMIKAFLDKRLPADWNTRNMEQRRAYFCDGDLLAPAGVLRRDKVSRPEILWECLGIRPSGDKSKYKSYEISALMKYVDGWELAGSSIQGDYGRQRVYKRIITEEEQDDDEEL